MKHKEVGEKLNTLFIYFFQNKPNAKRHMLKTTTIFKNLKQGQQHAMDRDR
jgi:hypothetical protein